MAPEDMTAYDLTEHDQHLAFAVAQMIAGLRGGGTVRVLGLPDVEDRMSPAVELLTVDAVGELAIEHTLIEPFEKEMEDRPRVLGYERELTERVARRLPAGSRFHLVVDAFATKGIKSTIERLDAIADWIVGEAPRLEIGSPRTAPGHQTTSGPPSLPFPVTLRRWPLSADSQLPPFAISVARPEDLEVRRRARVAQALDRKLPKLHKAITSGRDAVLVLESVDRQLSNAWDIGAAVGEAASDRGGWLPEWIVLVEADTGTPVAWVLRGGGMWVEEVEPRALLDGSMSLEVSDDAV